MLDIEKQFPGVKALDHAKLQLRPGSIHALMGENGAGKSTLMKCLFGIYKKDAGSIRMNGKEINFTSPRNALDHGVAMVHQELNQVLYRSVMENMWLGRFPLKAGLVDHKKMYNDTKAVLDDLEIKVDPKTIIGTMAVSQRQMLEIAKAVSYNAKILVLDEPTSSLTSEEVEHLFRIMRRLCDQGVGIIYISHKMDEIKRISDEVTIMRDGQWISTDKTENLSTDDIIKRMVNREMTNRFPAKDNVPGDVLMEVSHLTGKYMPTCQDVSFELRAGEVLGVAGLVGSRRTELLSTIFGIMSRESGEIKLNGKPISNKTPRQSIKNGFAMLTEERRATGIFPYASILFNTVISNLGSYRKGPLLSDKKMTADTDWSISSMHIKTPSQKTLIKNLSGGNQQKVILARELESDPDVLIAVHPTRGLDIGATRFVHDQMIAARDRGVGILLISADFDEILEMSDRIIVCSDGVAEDQLRKTMIIQAAPPGVHVHVVPIKKICEIAKDPRFGNTHAMLLFETPQDALRAIEGGVPIKKLNLGSMAHSVGKVVVTNALAMDQADVDTLENIKSKGVEFDIRKVPADKAESYDAIIKKAEDELSAQAASK